MDQGTQIFNLLYTDISELKYHNSINNSLVTLHGSLQGNPTWNSISKSIQTCIEDIYNMQLNIPSDKKAHARSLILNINLLQSKNDVMNILVPALEHNQIGKQKQNLNNFIAPKLTDSLKNSPYIAGKVRNQKNIETIQSLKESIHQPHELAEYQYNVLTNSKSGLHITQGRPWSGTQTSTKLNIKDRPSSDYAEHLQRYMQKDQTINQNLQKYPQEDEFQADDFQEIDTQKYNIHQETDIQNDDLNMQTGLFNASQTQQTLQQINIPTNAPQNQQIKILPLNSMTQYEIDDLNTQKYDLVAEQAEYAQLLREKTARKQAISAESRHNINQLLSQAPTQGTFTVQKEFHLFKPNMTSTSQLNRSGINQAPVTEAADSFKITEYHQNLNQNNQISQITVQEVADAQQPIPDPFGVHRSRQLRNSGIKPILLENLGQEVQRLQHHADNLAQYMCNELGYSPQACKSLLEKLHSGVRSWLKMNASESDYRQPNGLVNKVLDSQVRMGEVGAIQMKQLVYVMIMTVRLGLSVDDVFAHTLA